MSVDICADRVFDPVRSSKEPHWFRKVMHTFQNNFSHFFELQCHSLKFSLINISEPTTDYGGMCQISPIC